MIYHRGRSVDHIRGFMQKDKLFPLISSLRQFVWLIWDSYCQFHVAFIFTGTYDTSSFLHIICDEPCPRGVPSVTGFFSDVFCHAFISDYVGVFRRTVHVSFQFAWHDAQIYKIKCNYLMWQTCERLTNLLHWNPYIFRDQFDEQQQQQTKNAKWHV